MRRLLVAALALAALALPGIAHAATMPACAGTPVDDGYRSAFDGVNGQAIDGNVRFPVKTSLWGYQSWLTLPYQTPGHGSDHLHIVACLPQGETITSQTQLPSFAVAVTAHNAPGYTAVRLSGSWVTQSGSNAAFTATQAQLDRITTAMQTSGHLGANVVYLNMPALPVVGNGLKELRWGLKVVRAAGSAGDSALADTWELDCRNYITHAIPGLNPTVPINDQVRYIRCRSIVNGKYHHSGLCNMTGSLDGAFGCDSDEWNTADYTALRPDSWTMGTRVTDGGGPAAFEIDPNHHKHPDYRGIWFLDWYQFRSSVASQFASHTIPLGSLGLKKWHRLFFASDNLPDCERAGNPCPAGIVQWRNVVQIAFRRPE